MKFVELILLILALFTTFLWASKMITDSVSAISGARITNEEAEKDGAIRLYLIGIMSILWSTLIIYF